MELAVYGTLKRGRALDAGKRYGATWLRNTQVRGQLWSFGSYPMLYEGDELVDVEVFDVPKSYLQRIVGMEVGAGYVPRMTNLTDGSSAIVFWYKENPDEFTTFYKIDKY